VAGRRAGLADIGAAPAPAPGQPGQGDQGLRHTAVNSSLGWNVALFAGSFTLLAPARGLLPEMMAEPLEADAPSGHRPVT